jgi:ABC-type Co2+ transport system permease subunit
LGHGGLVQTLGLNITHYALPALIAGAVFAPLARSQLLHQPVLRFAAVTLVGWGWLLTAAVAAQTGLVKLGRTDWPVSWAGWWAADPALVLGLLIVAAGLAVAERRLEKAPAFPVGLLLGGLTAWATVGLTVLSLRFGGTSTVADKAELVLLLHVPVVAVEAVGVGFVVAYLNRAKPEWLAGHSGNTSANGTSH